MASTAVILAGLGMGGAGAQTRHDSMSVYAVLRVGSSAARSLPDQPARSAYLLAAAFEAARTRAAKNVIAGRANNQSPASLWKDISPTGLQADPRLMKFLMKHGSGHFHA